MLDRPIAAFDIETIPDPDVGRRMHGFSGTDGEVLAAMIERRRVETEGRTEYPQLPHHRVVTVGMAWLDPKDGRFAFGTCGDAAMDEPSHLRGFFERCGQRQRPVRLVSWNGAGFDLPIIRYRSMLHGIAAPGFYRTDGDWKWNNYQNRFHDMHVDLMDVLSGYGASPRVGLGTLAPLLGLPDKSFLTKPIYDHVLAGEEQPVREYCKLDCLETLLLYLVWSVHCGHLEPAKLRAHVDAIRSVLEAEPFGGWKGIAESLRGWPAWAQIE
ncbi:MAG: 3'-5' exonuclease [Myxococcota bacterium]